MIAQSRPALALAAAVAVLLVGGTAGATTAPGAVERALTVTVRGAGSVTIEPPGVVCEDICRRRYEPGTRVTLTPRGGRLVSWEGACENAEKACVLTLDTDTTVRAVFVVEVTPPPLTTDPPPVHTDPLEKALGRLRPASVAFNTPTTLRLGESTEIQLLLSIREPLARLEKQIAEIGEIEGATVRVSDDMEARLTGPGFEIEAISDPRQLVVESETTGWKWEIEATETGRHRLHLTLTAFIEVDGERRARTVQTFERTLVIDVTWTSRISGFVDDNWQWLWSAILVPVGLWVLQRRRRAAASEPGSGAPAHD